MRAVLLANHDDADPGFVGEHLRGHGYAFTECHRERPDGWSALEGVDLVLSLGSDWSVYWDHVQPYVSAECELLRAAHERGVPMLGICFGGQIVSHALGGSVAAAPEAEIGWFDVTSSTPSLAGSGPWFQWHSDRFTPPPGASVLASNARATQAYRLGRTLALQFHPEVNESIVARWSAGGIDQLHAHGIERDEMMARTRTEVERTRAAAEDLVDWFLGDVASP